MFLFLLLCILAMFAIHAITQIASKTEKLWAAKKHHHNFAFWCGMLCEDLSRRYTLSGDTTPQSFRLVKQAENPAPLTQGEPRTALRWLSARLYLTALRSRALSLPQSYCLNPERSPTAPSSEGAEAAAAAHHRIYLRGSQVGAADSAAVLKFPRRAQNCRGT